MRRKHFQKEGMKIARKLKASIYLLVETSSFKNISVLATSMPISFKEAYYEYRYGIFAE